MKKKLLSLALLLAACESQSGRENASELDAEVAPSKVPPSQEGCALKVSDGWIDHACLHANMGPFRERTASPAGATSNVDVSRAHTAFTLQLAPSDSGFSSDVRYLPRARGGHAIFISNDATVTVTADGSSETVARFASHQTELCPELPWVQALSLEAVPHTLHIESDQASVMVVLEYLDEGSPEDSYRHACTPDGGILALDAGRDAGSIDSGAADAEAQVDAHTDVDTSFSTPDSSAPDAEADASSLADAGDSGAECWIDPVLEHTCLHVKNGPYADVVAAANAASAPNINSPHTTYRIQVPSEGGWLTYRPNQEGEFVFYTSPGTSLELQSTAGALSARFDEPVMGCTGVGRAFVFELAAAQRYTIRVSQAMAETKAAIVVENVPALAPNGWNARLEKCE